MKPLCHYGYTHQQIEHIINNQTQFLEYSRGSTFALCEGNHPCRIPHGPVCYTIDLRNYLYQNEPQNPHLPAIMNLDQPRPQNPTNNQL